LSSKSVEPSSPDAPSTVTSFLWAFWYALRRLSSDCTLEKVSSVAPKLCEITFAR
jgi:hypothetical protein